MSITSLIPYLYLEIIFDGLWGQRWLHILLQQNLCVWRLGRSPMRAPPR